MLNIAQNRIAAAGLAFLLGAGAALAGATVVDPADDPGDGIVVPEITQGDINVLITGLGDTAPSPQLAQAIATAPPGSPEAQEAVATYLVTLAQSVEANGLPPMTEDQRDTVAAVVSRMLEQLPGNPQLTSLLAALSG